MKYVGKLAVCATLGLSLALGACGGSSGASQAPAADQSAEETSAEEAAEQGAAETEAAEQDAAEAEAAAQAEAEAAAQAEAEAAAQAEAEAEEAAHAEARSAAQAQGLTVVEGVVRVMNGEEMCAYDDKPMSLFGDEDTLRESTYVILELDEMTHFVGELADGSPGEGDDDRVGIGRDVPAWDFVEDTASQWVPYDGMRVCVAGNPWFQTDVSLPYAPRMYDAQLLYEVG